MGFVALTEDFKSYNEGVTKAQKELVREGFQAQDKTFTAIKAVNFAIESGSQLNKKELQRLASKMRLELLEEAAIELKGYARHLAIQTKGTEKYNATLNNLVSKLAESDIGNASLLKNVKATGPLSKSLSKILLNY